MDKALLYMYAPYWFRGQGVILKDDPPIKVKVDQAVAVQNPPKTLCRGQKTLVALFCGTPFFFIRT